MHQVTRAMILGLLLFGPNLLLDHLLDRFLETCWREATEEDVSKRKEEQARD